MVAGKHIPANLPPDDGKDPNARALGKKGGAAKTAEMTPERRAEHGSARLYWSQIIN
jgi:hypothetical protein